MRQARAQGWSWEAIAGALGVRRQTVHRKHAGVLADGRNRSVSLLGRLQVDLRGLADELFARPATS